MSDADGLTLEYLQNPNTVDFLVKASEYFIDYAKSNPNIKLTQFLSGRYIIGYVDRAHIDNVMESLGTAFVNSTPLALGLLDKASLDAAGITRVQEQKFLDLKGQGVLMGFVDTGIDYTKDVFKYEDGTSKIVSIFDQTIMGNPPYGLVVGEEYTNAQINEALKSENPNNIVPHMDTVGHGTFLASIAAGRQVDDFIGAAPDSELIVVKLKKARPYYLERFLIPPEQENVYESSAVMVGIEYIVRKAKELNRPVAICIGIGTNLGNHDGYSVFEEYLGEIASTSGICICTAGGNESQAKHHAQGIIAKAGEKQNIEVKVSDNKGKASNIYVSVRSMASDRMSVSIKSPTGEIVGRVPAKSGTTLTAKLVMEKSKVIVQYYFPLEGSSGQETVIKVINATPGIWTIIVHGDIILDGTFHAYLPLTGLGSPNVEFLTPTPNYTIVVPATALGTITCGAYDSVSDGLFAESSWGPTVLPVMSPDLVAPGVNVGGYYPNGYGLMSGTSVSTAITTGACALMLQWGIVEKNDVALSTFQIRAFLIRGCIRDNKSTYPNPQWGYGKLNLINTFNMMREF